MPAGDLFDLAWKVVTPLVTLFAGMAVWALTRHYRLTHLQAEHEQLRREKETLEGKLDETRRLSDAARQSAAERYDRVRARHQEARDKFYRIKKAYLGLRDQGVDATPGPSALEDLKARLTKVEAERDDAQRQVEQLEQQIAEITRFDGRLWLRPPAGDVPRFRPRADRRAVIISVLNLKGGVGKTTLTANLAATLATEERRALVIDLDYQRSLSMLLVGDKRRKELHGNQWTVQHFLRGPNRRLADLTARAEVLAPGLPHCSVLVNSDSPLGGDASDSLEETENRLMVEWLFDRTRPDPRFFLRAALHDEGLDYGYVLLDCPPRLTTACVNALAASDFVLVPTVPDSVSAHAVENLLWTLREFKDQLLPELAVAGIVPNMVRYRLGDPIEAHAAALRDLRDGLSGVWSEPVPIFKAGIKHDSAFGISAAELDLNDKLRLAVSDPEIRSAFRALADELEKEIRHHASRRATTVPAKPGARARSR